MSLKTCDCCGDTVDAVEAEAQREESMIYCAGCLQEGCDLDGTLEGLDDPY